MLKHEFATEPKLVELFQAETFNEWLGNANKFAVELIAEDPMAYDQYADMSKNINRITGDAFEVFTEILCSVFGHHPDIGLTRYDPVALGYDNGIDAYAYNLSNKLSAVQCKFSSDKHRIYDGKKGVDSFVAESSNHREGYPAIVNEHGRHKTLFFITSGAGVHRYTRETKFDNRIHSIGQKLIKPLVDKNLAFWTTTRSLLEQAQNNN